MSYELANTSLNGHSVGIILKEVVRRMVNTAQKGRFMFEAQAKMGKSGKMDDVFTNIDRAAQRVGLKILRECFPDAGILAEENEASLDSAFRLEPQNGSTVIFTIDPIDGTKAFIRRQSHGVGCMLSMVIGSEIVAAFVADINTNELYYYRPGSDRVHRISELNINEDLAYNGGDLIWSKFALLRDPPDAYCALSRETVGCFKSYEVSGGSIGIWAARLWKREVGALLIPAGGETPWDSNPVFGLSKKLGYVFYKPGWDGERDNIWVPFDPPPVTEKCPRGHDVLVLHKNDQHTGKLKRLMTYS